MFQVKMTVEVTKDGEAHSSQVNIWTNMDHHHFLWLERQYLEWLASLPVKSQTEHKSG